MYEVHNCYEYVWTWNEQKRPHSGADLPFLTTELNSTSPGLLVQVYLTSRGHEYTHDEDNLRMPLILLKDVSR